MIERKNNKLTKIVLSIVATVCLTQLFGCSYPTGDGKQNYGESVSNDNFTTEDPASDNNTVYEPQGSEKANDYGFYIQDYQIRHSHGDVYVLEIDFKNNSGIPNDDISLTTSIEIYDSDGGFVEREIPSEWDKNSNHYIISYYIKTSPMMSYVIPKIEEYEYLPYTSYKTVTYEEYKEIEKGFNLTYNPNEKIGLNLNNN